MKKMITSALLLLSGISWGQFTQGNLVVLQTNGSTTKVASPITLKEITPTGTAGITINLPSGATTPIQTTGVYSGSEGFLTTSTDNKLLIVGGYGTSSASSDIAATTSASVPRVVGSINASGTYQQVYSSNTMFSANDIRGGVSDGTNFWASGASVASADGINYVGPGTFAVLAGGATPAKAYGMRIFNGQLYYSTQKAGPNNTGSQLGILSVGTGLPTSGSPAASLLINTGAIIPQDFSFNATTDICYIAVSLNTSAGGIQKWTRSGSVWTLQYTLGTGASNIGAYGLVVDYSGTNPVIYATTFESAGNRVIRITDTGAAASAMTIVGVQAGVFNKGIAFSPYNCVAPSVTAAASNSPVCQGSALNITASVTGTTPLTYSWTGPNSFTSTLQNPTIPATASAAAGQYNLTVTNSCGSANGSTNVTVNTLPTSTVSASGSTTICSGDNVVLTASAGSSYVWSSGQTTQANTVTTSGNYSVTVTDANDCSATSTPTVVTVNPLVTPSVTISANTGTSICSGTTVTFSAVVTNGGVTPAYQWILNGANAGTNSTYVTAAINNNDVVSCVVTSSADCLASATATSNSLTMSTNSTVQSGDFTAKSTFVYKGENGVVYTVPNNAALTYAWSYSGTGATINGSANSVTVDFSSSATSGTLSVTGNSSCGSGTPKTLSIVTNDPINYATGNLDYSFVTVGCNRVDYTDTSATTGTEYSTGESTANVYQLKRLFTEIAHLDPVPKYLFLTGDLVMGYKGVADTAELVKQLTSWRQLYENHPLSATGIQLVAIPGNHETQDKNAGKTSYVEAERIFVRVMAPYIRGNNGPGVGGADNLATDQGKLTYSFNYGSDHFLIIDTDPVGKDSKTPYKWIASDIQAARAGNARHIFAFGHKPAYASPMKPGDGLELFPADRDSLWKYLEDNNCEAMFAAHQHLWDTIHPHHGKTYQVIAGNGGSRVETTFMGAGKQYLGYTLVSLYTDRKINVRGLGRDADMATTGGSLFSKNEDVNPTTVRANFNICLTTTSTTIVSNNNSYTWNGTTYTTSGNYTYTTANTQGCDSVATLQLTIVTPPAQPQDFTTGPTSVYAGQTAISYVIPNDPSVTYTWSYSGTGVTINGTTNSVTLDFSTGATSGTLSVTATNSAGTSTPRTRDITVMAPQFTAGNIVLFQTTGSVSKASNAVTLKEISPNGVAGITLNLPSSGGNPIQSAGGFGGSEGFLTTSTDGKFLVLAGYGTTSSFSDVTATSSATVPRIVGKVTPSGSYQQVYTSTTAYNLNDIRGAISDGTNFWTSGASVNNADGINYVAPGTFAALAGGSSPAKGYGIRIFNGQVYYSTQKAGPSNSSGQLGIFALGTGLPTSGTVASTQVINTGSLVPEDFSFNAAGTTCYIAINVNGTGGGIQKWTKSGATWTLQYTLGTGASNIGAYGLLVDYSGSNPVIYATTFESAGNRVIKITDTGAASTAGTLVAAQAGVYYKGVSFAPTDGGIPSVSLSVDKTSGTEAAATVITLTATASSNVISAQSVTVSVSGTGITAGDYSLSNTTITIPAGQASASVTFTVVDDAAAEGTETALITLQSPTSGIVLGSTISQSVVIADNDNTAPTIALNVASTSDYIDGGAASAPASPFAVSGTLGDIANPASVQGIDFLVNDAETAASGLTVNFTSSNLAVVPLAGLQLTGTGAIRNLKITSSAVGFSNITLTVSDGFNTASTVINYGSSDSVPRIIPANTFWGTGMSDASAAVPLDSNYFMVADDELDIINVYSRKATGLPVLSYNYASFLNLPDQAKPEVDAEAAAKSWKNPGRIYWIGSMSTSKAPFDIKPNRDRLFATTVSGTGAATQFSVVGYSAIRNSLIAWGDTYGYNFSASAAQGVDSKSISGFATEGMVFGPDSTTLWIGMRAPLVPTANRTKAVIAPIVNFEGWFNNGSQTGSPTFGAPIELNLNGRGIRDLIRLANGTYIIIAGSPADVSGLNEIYKWSGKLADNPILVHSAADGKLNLEAVMEVQTNNRLSMTQLQVISDGGSGVIYNDGNEAKDFGNLNLRKFRSDVLTSLDICLPTVPGITAQDTTFCPGSSTLLTVSPVANAAQYAWSNGATTNPVTVSAYGDYSVVVTDAYGCSFASSDLELSNCEKADINNDGITDIHDFLLFAPKYGTTCSGCAEDINADGTINITDFLLFAPRFNQPCSCVH